MLKFDFLEGISRFRPHEWDALVGDESPFLEWAWLASLEEAGCVGGRTGWISCPLVAMEGRELVGASPVYIKTHSEGEFVYDWDWASASESAGIPYYPKILAGIPFTPVSGRRFLLSSRVAMEPSQISMASALRKKCEEENFSGVHVNFCLEEEIEPLLEIGYQLRIGFQYHWENRGYSSFEDYLQSLKPKRRKEIRRERKKIAESGIRVEVFSGSEISDSLFEEIYRLYRSTVERYYYGALYLNREFFDLLRERFRDRLCLIMAMREGKVIAGAMNVQKGKVLYGRYWGTREWVPFLHFELCYYAGIEYCIEKSLDRYEPGAGGEYKQVRGFDARPTWSLHYLKDPRLAAGVNRFLEMERTRALEAVAWYQEKSALKKA